MSEQQVYVDVDCGPEHRYKPDDLDDADENQILLYHTTQGPKGIKSVFDMTATTEAKAQELGAMPCSVCFDVPNSFVNFPYMEGSA